MDGCRNLLEFLSMFTCKSGPCDEYQSYVIIYLLVKFQIYPTCVAKVIVKIPSLCFLKTAIPERRKLNFLTLLTSESDFELNTKVIACEII